MARTLIRPTGFVDSPFGHDGRVARLAGGLSWFASVELIHGDGRQGEAMGQYGKITEVADLPADAELIANLKAAAKRVETVGTALKPRTPKAPKPEIAVPEEFAAALAKVPAANAAFAAFAPSHRREYLEWVVEAKRAETRDKRIAQAVEWIAEGKKRNWKYENC